MQTDLDGEGYVEINILLLNGEIYITSVHGIVKEAAYLKKKREREKKRNLKTKIVISICCRGANIAKGGKK